MKVEMKATPVFRRIAPALRAGALLTLLALPALAQHHKAKDSSEDKPAKSDRTRIAVLRFTARNGKSDQNVLDAATTAISHVKRFKLVERDQFPAVIQELKLESGGAIDEETKKAIGKINGIDYIVYGSVNEETVKNYESTGKDLLNNTTHTFSCKAHIRITFHNINIETGETKTETYTDDEEGGGNEGEETMGRALEKVCKQMAGGMFGGEDDAAMITKVNADEGTFKVNIGRQDAVDMDQIYRVYIPASQMAKSKDGDAKDGDEEPDDVFVGYARPIDISKASSIMELVEWGSKSFFEPKKTWKKKGVEQFDAAKLDTFNKKQKKSIDRRVIIEKGQRVALVPNGKPIR